MQNSERQNVESKKLNRSPRTRRRAKVIGELERDSRVSEAVLVRAQCSEHRAII